jgi:hypothetical protein
LSDGSGFLKALLWIVQVVVTAITVVNVPEIDIEIATAAGKTMTGVVKVKVATETLSCVWARHIGVLE